MANGIYQNTIYGIAAKLPFKYTGAVVLGSNISGCFTAVLSIISEVMFTGSARTAAIYYFITALFILLICFDTYFALPLNVSLISCFWKISSSPVWKALKLQITLLTIFYLFSEILSLPRVAPGEERSSDQFLRQEGFQESPSLLENFQAGWTSTVQHLLYLLRHLVSVPNCPFWY